MSDIKLNEVTGDINFTNGSMSLIKIKSEAVVQRLKIRIQTALREWFIDRNIGVPYFELIFKQGTSKDVIDIAFKSVILETSGVDKILDFTSERDSKNRKYTLTFKVITTQGETLTITDLEV